MQTLLVVPPPKTFKVLLHGSNNIPWNHRSSTYPRASLSHGVHHRSFRHAANSEIRIVFAPPCTHPRHRVGASRPQAAPSHLLRGYAYKLEPSSHTPPGQTPYRSGARSSFDSLRPKPIPRAHRSRATSGPVQRARLRFHARPEGNRCVERRDPSKQRFPIVTYSADFHSYVQGAHPDTKSSLTNKLHGSGVVERTAVQPDRLSQFVKADLGHGRNGSVPCDHLHRYPLDLRFNAMHPPEVDQVDNKVYPPTAQPGIPEPTCPSVERPRYDPFRAGEGS